MPHSGRNTRPTGCGLGIKHNPGLLQDPRFNLRMMNPPQNKRAHGVMLFTLHRLMQGARSEVLTCTKNDQVKTGEAMRVVSYSEARNSLKSVLDTVTADHDITVIDRGDGADAVVMSFDHYQSVMETMHLASSPANAAKLAKAIAQDTASRAKARKLLDA